MKALGYKNVIICDPLDLAAMQQAIDDAFASEEASCIITRRPCVLLKRVKHEKAVCRVDADSCRSCRKCLKVGCPVISIREGKACIDANQCTGCTVCAQVCPFKAIGKEAR